MISRNTKNPEGQTINQISSSSSDESFNFESSEEEEFFTGHDQREHLFEEIKRLKKFEIEHLFTEVA